MGTEFVSFYRSFYKFKYVQKENIWKKQELRYLSKIIKIQLSPTYFPYIDVTVFKS